MLMMPLHPQCLPKQQNNNFDDNKCLSIKKSSMCYSVKTSSLPGNAALNKLTCITNQYLAACIYLC